MTPTKVEQLDLHLGLYYGTQITPPTVVVDGVKWCVSNIGAFNSCYRGGPNQDGLPVLVVSRQKGTCELVPLRHVTFRHGCIPGTDQTVRLQEWIVTDTEGLRQLLVGFGLDDILEQSANYINMSESIPPELIKRADAKAWVAGTINNNLYEDIYVVAVNEQSVRSMLKTWDRQRTVQVVSEVPSI